MLWLEKCLVEQMARQWAVRWVDQQVDEMAACWVAWKAVNLEHLWAVQKGNDSAEQKVSSKAAHWVVCWADLTASQMAVH